jgi:hypothetical protein
MWARIDNFLVEEITEIDPSERFHPSIQWVECSIDTQTGWHFDGEHCIAPPEENLSGLAARKRFSIETARKDAESEGVAVHGIRYAGDPGNRQAIMEVLDLVTATGQESIASWKDSDGRFHADHPVTDVRQALMAIATRRGELISREGELNAQIAAALDAQDRETLEAIAWSEE